MIKEFTEYGDWHPRIRCNCGWHAKKSSSGPHRAVTSIIIGGNMVLTPHSVCPQCGTDLITIQPQIMRIKVTYVYRGGLFGWLLDWFFPIVHKSWHTKGEKEYDQSHSWYSWFSYLATWLGVHNDWLSNLHGRKASIHGELTRRCYYAYWARSHCKQKRRFAASVTSLTHYLFSWGKSNDRTNPHT